MADTLINHVPLHPLQYPEQGQNYVFNGCMKFLMECIGENNEQYDYWFFSAVSGDSYVQVVNTNKEKWSTCFSHAKFDYELIKRVFDAAGYNVTYLEAGDWRKEKEAVKRKIREYIDKGIPVIGKGFYTMFEGGELPTSEISCIIGYENDGENFYRMTEETTDLVAFTLEDGLPYTFVFIGDKKDAPPVAESYRNALKNAPQLMRTPPGDNQEVYFGKAAFEQWARMLENGFYRMTREEYETANAIANWRYYCIYICIIATNIFSKRYTTDRALQMNPDLAKLAPLLERENRALEELEKELQAAGGDFNVTYEVLQDAEKCREIARIMRKFPTVLDRICEAIEGKERYAGMEEGKIFEYDEIIHEIPEKGGAYVIFPWNIREVFGKGRVKVRAEFDGIPYEGSIVNMGVKDENGNICYIIGLLKAIRQKLGKGEGDSVHVVIKERE